MPLDANATMLSIPQLKPGLLEAYPRRNPIASVFPLVGVAGASLDFAVHGTFATPLQAGQVLVNATTALTDQTASPTAKRTFGFDLYGTRFSIPYYYQDRLTVPNDLELTERTIAERQILYAYYERLFQTALSALVDATNMVVTTATPFDLDDLDEAYFKIRDNEGRPTAIASRESTLRLYLSALRAAGQDVPYVPATWSDPVHGTVTAPRIALHGTPWYISDLFTADDDGTPQVWFMVLGEQESPGPGHGLVGIVPEDRVGDPFIVRPSTPDAQFVNVDLLFPAGFALGSPGALSGYRFTP